MLKKKDTHTVILPLPRGSPVVFLKRILSRHIFNILLTCTATILILVDCSIPSVHGFVCSFPFVCIFVQRKGSVRERGLSLLT